MDRREFLLVTAAVGGFAGCGSRSDEQRSTESTTKSPTEIISGSPTEAQTEERSRAQTAAHIDEARGHLETAITEYTAFDPLDAGLLDVSASVTDFEYSPITDAIWEARDELDRAAETARENQQSTITSLRSVATALEQFARAQADLGNAYDLATAVRLYWFREQFQELRERREGIRGETEPATGYLDTLEAETDPAAMDAFEPLGRDRYERKLAQLRAEIDTAEELQVQFTPLEDGLEQFGMAVDDYVAENWDRAGNEFGDAATTLDGPARELAAHDAAPAFATVVDDLARVTQTLADASDALEAAATAAESGNRPRQRRYKDQADDTLLRRDIAVHRIRSVQHILRPD